MNRINLESFIMVYECQNFTKAAEKLFVTQPTLSRRIKSLEESIGIKLFDRDTNTFSVTHAGEAFYREALKLICYMDESKNKMFKYRDNASGILRIGITPTSPYLHIEQARMIERFYHKYPEIDISVITASSDRLTKMLLNKKIDMAFMHKSEVYDITSINFHELDKEYATALVSINSKFWNYEEIKYHDLNNANICTYSDDESNLWKKGLSVVTESGIFPRGIRLCDSIAELILLVSSGKYVGFFLSNLDKLIPVSNGNFKNFPLNFDYGKELIYGVAFCNDNNLAKTYIDYIKEICS